MPDPDQPLRDLANAIGRGEDALALRLLAATPVLARATFQAGTSRGNEKETFLTGIGRYIWAGDTALHIAAAAYSPEVVRALLAAGADVRARNRLGDEPLHSASVGQPGSCNWNPDAQAATIRSLVQAGADPNALNKTGVAPLHRAVRTRCAAAVRTLLECGADPVQRNQKGSTPLLLATHTTGRGGSGSPAAKAEQQEILRILRARA